MDEHQRGPHGGDRLLVLRSHLCQRCERAWAVRELEVARFVARSWGQRAWRQTDEDVHLEGYFSEFSGAWRRSLDFSPQQGSPAQRPAGRGLGAGCVKMPMQEAALRRAGLLPKVGRSPPQGGPAHPVDVSPNSVFREAGNLYFYVALLFLDVRN